MTYLNVLYLIMKLIMFLHSIITPFNHTFTSNNLSFLPPNGTIFFLKSFAGFDWNLRVESGWKRACLIDMRFKSAHPIMIGGNMVPKWVLFTGGGMKFFPGFFSCSVPNQFATPQWLMVYSWGGSPLCTAGVFHLPSAFMGGPGGKPGGGAGGGLGCWVSPPLGLPLHSAPLALQVTLQRTTLREPGTTLAVKMVAFFFNPQMGPLFSRFLARGSIFPEESCVWIFPFEGHRTKAVLVCMSRLWGH